MPYPAKRNNALLATHSLLTEYPRGAPFKRLNMLIQDIVIKERAILLGGKNIKLYITIGL